MTEPAAIMGTFADLKTVKTRSVVQMIIEVPIEHGEQIIAAFGFPRPGAEVPVAVARLDPEKASTSPAASDKPKKPFKDYKLSQQAGMRCGDDNFTRFLKDIKGWHGIENAAAVRTDCNVLSRTEFDTSPEAAKRWKAYNAEYEQWAGLSAEPRNG